MRRKNYTIQNRSLVEILKKLFSNLKLTKSQFQLSKKAFLNLNEASILDAVKKSFFKTSTRLLFCPVEFFLRIFQTHYAYVICLLESK